MSYHWWCDVTRGDRPPMLQCVTLSHSSWPSPPADPSPCHDVISDQPTMKILRWRITCVNYNNRCRVGQTLNVEMWILCLRWCGRPVKVTPASSKCSWKQVCTTFCHSASECVCVLSPVRTGDKVDCRRNRRQIQRSRLSPIRSTLSAVLAKNRQQLVADDIVASTVNFVSSVYGAKATQLSTFNDVDRIEFNSVASVYRA